MGEEQSHGIASSNKQIVHAANTPTIEQVSRLAGNVMPDRVHPIQIYTKDAVKNTEKKKLSDESNNIRKQVVSQSKIRSEKGKAARAEQTKRQIEEKKSQEIKKESKTQNQIGIAGLRKEAEKKTVISTEKKQSFGIKKDTAINKIHKSNQKGIRFAQTRNQGKDMMKAFVRSKRIAQVLESGSPDEYVKEASQVGIRAVISFAGRMFKMAIRAAASVLKMILAPIMPFLVILVPVIVVVCLIVSDNQRTAMVRAYKQAELEMAVCTYPESVEQWRSFVTERCRANNDSNSDIDLTLFVDPILATIMQESGGDPNVKNGDVMQCAAAGSRYWNTPMPSDWSDAQRSIDVGIRVFYDCLKNWHVTSPTDFEGLKMVAQGYNYGPGFFDWARKNGYSSWSLDMSTEFSNLMAKKQGWKSYGHKTYASEWVAKLQSANAVLMINPAYEYHTYCQFRYTGQPKVACGVTALASACRSLGCNVNPNDLEAHNNNLVGLEYGCVSWLNNNFPITITKGYDSSPSALNNALNSGSLLVVYLHSGSTWINGSPVTYGDHWIVLIGYTKSGNLAALNPGTGIGNDEYCKAENCEGGVSSNMAISMNEVQETISSVYYIVTPDKN